MCVFEFVNENCGAKVVKVYSYEDFVQIKFD